jgi:putative ABC transport system permease protein
MPIAECRMRQAISRIFIWHSTFGIHMVLPKLVLSNFLNRKARVALTLAAIALSVSLVVSVTSGYTSIEAAAYKFFTHYLGSTDAVLSNSNYGNGVPESLIARFKADPRVKDAIGRLDTENIFPSPPAKSAEVIGILPDDPQLGQMYFESGWWFNSSTGDVAVIDQGAAKALNVAVGGEVALTELDKKLILKVSGIVHKPDVMASFRPTIYVPLHTLQKYKGTPGQVTKISVELKNHSDADKFVAEWRPKVEQIDRNIKMRSAGDSRKSLEQNLSAVHLLSYLGGLVAMITATFIVFSTLSMGVSERQRTLAMLRAVGAFKSQIAWLVILEGIVISLVGALIGVVLGVAWVHILVWKFDKLFYAGVVISYGGVVFGVVGSILSALAASLLPAWSASRVTPLEAMTPLATSGSGRIPWISALIGLSLIGIDPLVLYGPTEKVLGMLGAASPHDAMRLTKFYSHFMLGLPSVFVGFFLVSPLLVWLVERVLGPLLAVIMRLKFALLRQQLSSGLWRAAGTCTALMVGLAILVALQTEGRTAINGWKLPDKFPDMFIVDFSGIPLSEAPKLEHIPGIKHGQVMPIAIVSPDLPKSFLSIMGQEKGTLSALMLTPDRTMFIGIDPNVAFKMLELDFREGNVVDAERLLKLGDHVLVTAEFKRLKGLGVGDKLPLKTDQGWRDFTIAGVVWSPGIDVIVTAFDMGRQMDQRTAASVFGTIGDAEKYFGIHRFMLFAANLDAGADKDIVLKRVQKELKSEGMRGGDVRKIKNQIEADLKNFLLLISTVAFAAMAVAALGVTNTIMASIRSRRWQFGILRSIGVTRSQLLRLVIAEAILLGIVGCALGVPAGLLLSMDAEAVQVAVTGYAPSLFIPWNFVALGVGAIMLVSVLASLWPAILVARTETLELLQAGRASA